MVIEKPPARVALALGSNLGDRLKALKDAVSAITSCVTINAVSPVYETPAAYVTNQPQFLNAALLGTTALEPLALLWSLKDIERELGRTPTFRFGPRTIDIDILFYDDLVLETLELTIPHPRLHERDFVLKPLSDLNPDLRHAKTGVSVAQMLAPMPPSSMICLGNLLS
ncbi:MAG: 2-amino-4-hydroxy-6-hydroxymethyldihydropteridine diphosphokinase [Alphaproteobacteria bacterium]|nr:2-amino-4-hydroxy-6-hydroxymethyldihydropteridine diphosphokinase [Alphaproteobacteria bacterium]